MSTHIPPTPAVPRPPLNIDPAGRDLTISIRLAPDGRVYFHDVTPDLVPIVQALKTPATTRETPA